MYILIFMLSLFRVTVISLPAGSFDYGEYNLYAHVVEGEFISEWADSVRFRVTEVWTGSSEPGDELTLYTRFSTFLEQDDKALFMSDSTGALRCFGSAREGFYILAGNTSPNILTVDDLELLSNSVEPEFNKHESNITVHFPISSEEIDIRVIPEEYGRRTRSSYSEWDNLDPFGAICSGNNNYMTEFSMIPAGEDLYLGVQLGTFAGDVQKYSEGVYYIDVWPEYPCFGSIQSMEEFYEYGTVPVYVFRIEMENPDYWSIGLTDEAYLVSAGEDFYLRGRQRYVSEDTRGYLDNSSLFFRAFASGGSTYSSRSTLLMINDMDRELNRPLLATMLEELKDGPISGILYFVESDDTEPELYSDCTINLYTPIFEITAICDTTIDALMNDAILSFNDTGSAILEYDGRSYTQIHRNLEFQWNNIYPRIRQYNYAVFNYPGDEDCYLLLHFSSLRQATYLDGADDMLVSGIIHHWLGYGNVDGIVYKLDRTNSETEQVGTFSMSRI